ncbi:MAG: hypothetical protein HGA54_01115 [Actinobacteria bacterium]|nr:hypothetical protein [Actinomycetota bacterium]
MTRSRQEFSPKLIKLDTFSTQAAMKRLAAKGCRKFWWHTAVPEITVGAAALLIGSIYLIFHNEIGPTALGWALSACVLAITAFIPSIMRTNFIIPSGLCLSVPERPTSHTLSVLFGALICGAIGIYSSRFEQSSLLVIASVLALALLALYAFSGVVRHYVLGAWLLVSAVLGLVISNSYSASSIVAIGIALLLFGLGVLVAGLQAFLRLLLSLVSSHSAQSGHVVRMMSGWYTPDEIAEALLAPDPETRFLVAAFLCEYIEPQVLAPLINATRDGNAAVATMACTALSNIWGPDPNEVLRWQIAHTLNGKRRTNARSLSLEEFSAINHDRSVIEKDARLHEREVESVMKKQVAADDELLERLIDLAIDEYQGEEDVRCVAAELLGSSCSHRAYAVLVQLILKSGNRSVAQAASEGFRGASSGAIVHIEPLLKDSREWVRVAAIHAGRGIVDTLTETNSKEAGIAQSLLHDAAFELAKHDKPVTRAMALGLLAHYGEEARSVIEACCKDNAALVRGEGLRALSFVDAKIAASYAIDALRDSRAYVRSAAIDCVARLRLKEAQPILAEMVHDSDKRVAFLAEKLLFLSRNW